MALNFASVSTYPLAIRAAATAVNNGYIYVLGGYTTNINAPVTNVYRAQINGDGSLGSWTAMSSINVARSGGCAFAFNGYMYHVGGRQTSAAAVSGGIIRAVINGDDTLGTFATAATIDTPRFNVSCVVTPDGYLYTMGGTTASAVGSGVVSVNAINLGTNAVGAATTTTATETTTDCSSWMSGTKIYFAKGGTATSVVFSGTYTGASIPSWTNIGYYRLPSQSYGKGLVKDPDSDDVWGANLKNLTSTEIIRGTINPDLSMGWVRYSSPTVPTASSNSDSPPVFYNQRYYLIGASQGGTYNGTVYMLDTDPPLVGGGLRFNGGFNRGFNF